MKLLKDDMVMVLSGNFRGHGPAKIVSLNRDSGKAIVEGLGQALKHVKRGHPKSPQGGRVTIPVSVDMSNLALHCSGCNRGVRVQVQLVNGKKTRVCGRCKKTI